MAHKTLISGTAYSVTGGRELIGGTGYGCKGGKTLIGGTAFTIPFGPKQCTIIITGSGEGYSAVEIAGTYYQTATTLVLEAGTVIKMHTISFSGEGPITVDGKTVATASPGKDAEYEMEVAGNMQIALGYKDAAGYAYGFINATTT